MSDRALKTAALNARNCDSSLHSAVVFPSTFNSIFMPATTMFTVDDLNIQNVFIEVNTICIQKIMVNIMYLFINERIVVDS